MHMSMFRTEFALIRMRMSSLHLTAVLQSWKFHEPEPVTPHGINVQHKMQLVPLQLEPGCLLRGLKRHQVNLGDFSCLSPPKSLSQSEFPFFTCMYEFFRKFFCTTCASILFITSGRFIVTTYSTYAYYSCLSPFFLPLCS